MNVSSTGSMSQAWAMPGMQRGGPPPGAGRMSGSQGTQSMEEMFAEIDSDGDGSISQAEFEAFKPEASEDSAASPSSFDVQRSTSEFAMQMGPGGPHGAGGPPPGPPPSLSEKDSNEDGSISAEEFGITGSSDAKATELFDKIDSDGSGDLSSEEVEAFESLMAEQRPHGPGGPPPAGMGQDGGLGSLDSDDDGSVSAEEFGLDSATESMQQLFEAIDGDEDGSLSSEEIQDFQSQMMALQARQYSDVAASGSDDAAATTTVSTTA